MLPSLHSGEPFAQKLIGPEANPVKLVMPAIASLTANLSAAKSPVNLAEAFVNAGLSMSKRSCICEKSWPGVTP